MKQIIENVRQKPHHERNRIIWICAGIGVGLLLALWAIVGSPKKADTNANFLQSVNQRYQDGKNLFTNPTNK